MLVNNLLTLTRVGSHITNAPPELLMQVFLLAMERFPMDRTGPGPCVTAISLSHVCSHWRAVALSVKELWTYVPFQLGDQCIQTALDRSRPFPIDFDTRVHPAFVYHNKLPTNKQVDTLLLPLAELARIRHLRLSVPCWGDSRPSVSDDFVHHLRTIFTSTPVPILESIEIATPDDWLSPVFDTLFSGVPPPRLRQWVSECQELPEAMLGNNPPPSLRELVLEQCRISTPPCIFNVPLTTLKITLGSIGESLDDMIVVLSRLPTLQRLDLYSIYIGDPEIHPDTPAAELPHLTHFSLYEPSIDTLAIILRMLTIPTNTNFIISVNGTDGDLSNELPTKVYNLLVDQTAPMVRGGGRFSTVQIKYDDVNNESWPVGDGAFVFRMEGAHRLPNDSVDEKWDGGEISSTFPTDSKPPLPEATSVVYGIDDIMVDPGPSAPPLLRKLITLPCLASSVQTLSINYPNVFRHTELWTELSSVFNRVEVINVTSRSAHGLLLAMAANIGPGTAQPTLFPRVHRLLLFKVKLNIPIARKIAVSVAMTLATLIPLYNWDTVRIKRCTVPKPVIEALQVLGARAAHPTLVEWDGGTGSGAVWEYQDFESGYHHGDDEWSLV
jgi:hypothetical protein